jgi:hypothetical protein
MGSTPVDGAPLPVKSAAIETLLQRTERRGQRVRRANSKARNSELATASVSFTLHSHCSTLFYAISNGEGSPLPRQSTSHPCFLRSQPATLTSEHTGKTQQTPNKTQINTQKHTEKKDAAGPRPSCERPSAGPGARFPPAFFFWQWLSGCLKWQNLEIT